jgi:asparagine synthase (glutamine-hydrolysing)
LSGLPRNLRRKLEQPVGDFNSQLKRNNLETALSLAAWLKDYQLAL